MGQTLRRTGPQMKRSGGVIAPAVLAKKKAPARDILIDEPETDELRAFGGSRSDKFNGVLINAMARTGWFPPGQTDEACSQQMFAAVAALRAFKPTDEIEGMLATPCAGCLGQQVFQILRDRRSSRLLVISAVQSPSSWRGNTLGWMAEVSGGQGCDPMPSRRS
jgi:hypothetical protein